MEKGHRTSMAVVSLLLITTVFLASVDQASALKCWRCSTDAVNGEFCRDPFDETAVTAEQRRQSYVECAMPPLGSNKVPVCKKLHQTINDKAVVTRACVWDDVDASPDNCQNVSVPSYVRILLCRTCNTDGCNVDAKFADLRSVSDRDGDGIPDDVDLDDGEDDDEANSGAVGSSTSAAAIGSLVSVLMTASLLVR